MSELRECPFQKEGEHHEPRVIDAVGEAWVLCSCGASGETFSGIDRIDRAIDFWNTRAEKTCQMIMHEGSPACSKCLRELDYDAKFCDFCGAKVVKS